MLAHAKPWDTKSGLKIDVEVIEALPRVLGESFFDFNDAMVGLLRLLSRDIMEAAAAEAHMSEGGGTNEGLAEDEASSSGGALSSGTGGSSGGGLSSGTGGSSGGGLSSGAGGSSSDGGRGSSSGGGRGSGIRAMADECTPVRRGAPAGFGQCTPLVYTTGRRGVLGQGGQRAAALAPSLHVQRSFLAPSAAVGLRLP